MRAGLVRWVGPLAATLASLAIVGLGAPHDAVHLLSHPPGAETEYARVAPDADAEASCVLCEAASGKRFQALANLPASRVALLEPTAWVAISTWRPSTGPRHRFRGPRAPPVLA